MALDNYNYISQKDDDGNLICPSNIRDIIKIESVEQYVRKNPSEKFDFVQIANIQPMETNQPSAGKDRYLNNFRPIIKPAYSALNPNSLLVVTINPHDSHLVSWRGLHLRDVLKLDIPNGNIEYFSLRKFYDGDATKNSIGDSMGLFACRKPADKESGASNVEHLIDDFIKLDLKANPG